MASFGSEDSEYGGDGDCGVVNDESYSGLAPVDVIFVVDNSGSMQLEEAAVQASMNDFSNAIAGSDIDVRVVLVSNYNICVPAPLGSGGCPTLDSNPPSFTHIDVAVGSTNALSILLDPVVFASVDAMTRETSLKHVVVVSDDDSFVSAQAFDQALRAKGDRYEDYRFHAIVASASPEEAPCIGISAAAGLTYMTLVEERGGVLGDLCGQDFAPVFAELATSVMESTPVACEWDVPPPPPEEQLDPGQVEVTLVVEGQEEQLAFTDSADACAGEDGWYFEPDNLAPTTLRVCPKTCARVQGAADAEVSILFPCLLPPENQE